MYLRKLHVFPRTPEGNDERFLDEQEYQRMRKQYP